MTFAIIFSAILFICGIIFFITDTGQMMPVGLRLIPFINNSLFEEVVLMSLSGWGAVIFLGVFSTVIGYYLWYVVLEIKNASQISIYLYFIPVLSTIISYIFFGEEITWFFIIGGVFVVIGLYIVNKQGSKDN